MIGAMWCAKKKSLALKKTSRNHKHGLKKSRNSRDLGDRPDRTSLFYPTILCVEQRNKKE
jgi:hypothetical protein